MSMRWLTWIMFVGSLLLAAVLQSGASSAVAADRAKTRILVVAGPSTHPPGTHECAAGARVIEYLLEHVQSAGPIEAEVVDKWPSDKRALDNLASIVFTGDLFPAETMADPAGMKADLGRLMDRGCGMVCVHYATGLRAQHVTAEGDHPLLRWIGGYFATGCKHHQSVARVCPATLVPAAVDHPVSRGWKAFAFDDEPYWNNYFGKAGPAENVTPLVTAMLPPEAPKQEIVAWAVQRPDGGRGLGIVVPHFFRNWRMDDLRTLVLNGVCWTAKLDIPPEGIQVAIPDLATFQPTSVETKPRPAAREAK